MAERSYDRNYEREKSFSGSFHYENIDTIYFANMGGKLYTGNKLFLEFDVSLIMKLEEHIFPDRYTEATVVCFM